MNRIKAIVGLFIPVPDDYGNWNVTFAVGRIPFGWIVVVIAYLVRYLP